MDLTISGVIAAINYWEMIAITGFVSVIIVCLMCVQPPIMYIGIAMLFVSGVLSQAGKLERLNLEIKGLKVHMLGQRSLIVGVGGLLLIIGSFTQGAYTAANKSPEELRDTIVAASKTLVGKVVVPAALVQYATPRLPVDAPSEDELKEAKPEN
jgi:hypothetical protein